MDALPIKGFWFSGEDGITEYQKQKIKVGQTLTIEGELIPCKNGLHFSPTPFDALQYAQGPILWKIEASADAVAHGDPVDKYCSSKRKHVSRIDATKLLRRFAASQALSVISRWGESEGVDRGDIRVAAWVAARVAAWVAARDASRAAARDAFNELVEEEFAKGN